jgi:hypothetical protein
MGRNPQIVVMVQHCASVDDGKVADSGIGTYHRAP